MSNESALRKLRIYSVIGIFLSTYATYVELKSTKDANYVALCDVSAKISCTAVFSTVYGRGFGLLQTLLPGADYSWIPPNGEIGIIYYSLIFVSSIWYDRLWLSYIWLFVSILSNLLSIYLAYLLYYVLKNFCLVCVAIYVVNHYILKQIWSIYETNKIEAHILKMANEQNDERTVENYEDKKQM